jgi:hypothetical protein
MLHFLPAEHYPHSCSVGKGSDRFVRGEPRASGRFGGCSSVSKEPGSSTKYGKMEVDEPVAVELLRLQGVSTPIRRRILGVPYDKSLVDILQAILSNLWI